MGTECFCQVYLTTIFNMVEKNPHFIANRSKLDLRFEGLHRGRVEAEHRLQMREGIAAVAASDPCLLSELQTGYEDARKSFHAFFANIYEAIDGRAVAPLASSSLSVGT